MSAVSLNRDTFKVNQLLMIPGPMTNLAIVALEDLGVLIIDTETKTILKEYDVGAMHPFKEQAFQEQGNLVVFNIAPDWPYSFHVLSNYGIYIFTFSTNLTNRADVLANKSAALEPLTVRLIETYFNSFNHELASNAYGYAFLVARNTSINSFDIFLGGVSFNGNQNSKVLRMIKIDSNLKCISLNQEPYLASSPED